MEGRHTSYRTACDLCKRMKIKCEWETEATKCNRCQTRELDCTVTTKERRKREKKKANHISFLEDRLKWMETAMTNSGLSLDRSKHEKDRNFAEDIYDQAEMIDKFSTLNIGNSGGEEFIGAASGFSLFSPQGLKEINSITGSNEFSEIMAGARYLTHARTPISSTFWYAMPDEEHSPLPSREIADHIIDFVFARLIPNFPIFDKKDFYERYHRQYPVKCSDDPAWYACLNMCFAWAVIIRKEDLPGTTPPPSDPPTMEHFLWNKWLRNAASTFVDLQLGQPSLMAVQAMAGIAFILSTIPNQYPCSVMASATIRLAQAIGLHRNLNDVEHSAKEIELRRNVFWIVIMIERTVVWRTGRPSAIHDDDIGVDLPTATLGSQRYVTFRHNVTLCLLQGRIYNRLYSAKSLTKSKEERLKLVGMLDDELQQWRETIPIEVRPGHKLKCDFVHLVPLVRIHWIYWQILTTVHRVSLYYGPGNGEHSGETAPENFDPTLNPRVYASAAICVHAARSSISLLDECARLSSPYEANILRMMDYYPLSACLTLFANLLQHPLDPKVQNDIRLINSVTTFLGTFIGDQNSIESNPVLPKFVELSQTAAEYVRKAHEKAAKSSKRSRGQSFKTEERSPKSNTYYGDIPADLQAAFGFTPGARIPRPHSASVTSQQSPTTSSSYLPSSNPSQNQIPIYHPHAPPHLQQQLDPLPQQMTSHPSDYQTYPINEDYSHSHQQPQVQAQSRPQSQMDQYPHHHASLDTHQPRPQSQIDQYHDPSSAHTYSTNPQSHQGYPGPSNYASSQHDQMAMAMPVSQNTAFGVGLEEFSLPQDGTWFYPVVSPWFFEDPYLGSGDGG